MSGTGTAALLDYLRPRALAEPADRYVHRELAWVEPEPLADAYPGRRDLPRGRSDAAPRYAVRRAFVVAVDGRYRWLVETLARGVAPLAAALLVDGLRALADRQVP